MDALPDITPEWLAAQLRAEGRSQSALARAMGVDTSAVNRICNGKRKILASELPVIRAYLASNVREAPNVDVRAEIEDAPYSIKGVRGDADRAILTLKAVELPLEVALSIMQQVKEATKP